jgi:hypothetical protein
MRILKASLASLAVLLFAGGMSLNAAHALTKPGAPAVSSALVEVGAKAKAKKVAAGKCGTYMYYKGKKCMDARAKK